MENETEQNLLVSILPNLPRPKLKVLLVELWGLGDAIFLTGVINNLINRDVEVTLLAKPATRALLEPSFSLVRWEEFDAPWTRFSGKYCLWRWPWLQIFGLLVRLRSQRFDIAASVRSDPRDHLLIWLCGTVRRVGMQAPCSNLFLTDELSICPREHRVETWSRINSSLWDHEYKILSPTLPRDPDCIARAERPITIHVGARIAVRRWPINHWKTLIAEIRKRTNLPIEVILDPDGFGSELAPLVNNIHCDLTLSELVTVINRANVFLANDSGPSHIAAALRIPVFAIFGPTEPNWFRPYGEKNHVAIRDICPHRPCFDYCKFSEPYCLTKLMPKEVWEELHLFLDKHLIGSDDSNAARDSST